MRKAAHAAEAAETMPAPLAGVAVPAQTAIVLLDSRYLITGINTEARQLLHCTLPDLAGRDFWDVTPEAVAEQHHALTVQALDSYAQHRFVVHHEFEDNWIEYAFIRHAAGCTVSLRDVSSTRNMERLLHDSDRRSQLVFEANPNAMWLFDASTLRIIAANVAAVEFYGIPHKIFLKLKMGALFPDGEGAALLSSLDTGKSGGDGGLTVQVCKQKKADGQLVLVELACGRIRWHEQLVVLVSLADVTERHLADRALRRENAEMEEELERVRSELDKASRDLAAFTYALSNDMQAPLHAANGFAALLIEKHAPLLDDSGRHYINRIQASTRRMARLVDDLRMLVHLPQPGTPEALDVAVIGAALMEELRKKDPERVVTMEVDCAMPLFADRTLLTVAMAGLLDNAWKFTSKKSDAWIRVALRQGATPTELVLQVSDNGTGFDSTYSDKLFTAFQRLHSFADYPGNGLGLAIVKSVAERHGGRVWAASSPAGASFYMAFPQDLPPVNLQDEPDPDPDL